MDTKYRGEYIMKSESGAGYTFDCRNYYPTIKAAKAAIDDMLDNETESSAYLRGEAAR